MIAVKMSTLIKSSNGHVSLMLITRAVFATATLTSPRTTVNTFLIYTNKVNVCIGNIFKTGKLFPITAALIKLKIVMA